MLNSFYMWIKISILFFKQVININDDSVTGVYIFIGGVNAWDLFFIYWRCQREKALGSHQL